MNNNNKMELIKSYKNFTRMDFLWLMSFGPKVVCVKQVPVRI
jgi:hypothetical protein